MKELPEKLGLGDLQGDTTLLMAVICLAVNELRDCVEELQSMHESIPGNDRHVHLIGNYDEAMRGLAKPKGYWACRKGHTEMGEHSLPASGPDDDRDDHFGDTTVCCCGATYVWTQH